MINLYQKEGELDMVRTLFLYLISSELLSQKNNNIYFFENNKIVGVDTKQYNSRISRYKLQEQYKIIPYIFSNEILNNMFNYAIKNSNHIHITSLHLKDEEVEEEYEFKVLSNDLMHNNYDNIVQDFYYIVNEYDTQLINISFKYKGYEFKIGNEGIIEVDAPKRIFNDFLKDDRVNLLLLGAMV